MPSGGRYYRPRRVTSVKAEGFWQHLWYCDNCGTSPGGSSPGMSVALNLQCPECQHHRCKFCNVERVFYWKVMGIGTPMERHIPGSFCSRSLAVLPKRPSNDTRKRTRSLTISRGEAVEVPVDSSHDMGQNLVPPPAHSISMDDSNYIDPSKISPPNSPPGLSPSSTETSIDSSISSDSSVPSLAMTDLESDVSTPSLEDFNSDGYIESEPESPTSLLDARLLVVLGYDLELAARLIPRIHAFIQRNSGPGRSNVRVFPSQAAGTTGQTPGASVNTSSLVASSTSRGTDPKRRKHKDNSEDEDGEETHGNKRSKKHRKRWDSTSSVLADLLVHSTSWTRINTHLLRIEGIEHVLGLVLLNLEELNHFVLSHRPPQCERCYNIFENVTKLMEHRRSEPPCTQNGAELKEGVDDGQWEMIKELLKVPRGLSSSEKAQHDERKWFELWTILFPDTPPPQHPWSDSEETKLAPATSHVAALIDTFDRIIALDIERGNLQRDDYVHERYRLAVRQLLEAAIAVSSQGLVSSPLPALGFNSGSRRFQGFSPSNGVSPTQLLPPSPSPYAGGPSPTALIRGSSFQDAPQTWTPRSQMDNSTPSTTTQNSLAAQWGTPQEFSTPATSSSQDTSTGGTHPSTAGSQVQYETLGYNLDDSLSLLSQIGWDDEWEQLQSFELSSATQQGEGIEPRATSLDSEENRTGQHFPPENEALDAFATSQSLTEILALEIDLPTAGGPIKDHRDRNKGLQKPLYDE